MRLRSMRNFWIHPLTLFVSVWGLAYGLYALQFSNLLVVKTSTVGKIVLCIVLPFAAAVVYIELASAFSPKRKARAFPETFPSEEYFQRIERALDRWFRYWIILSLIEIMFSRGIPLLWLLHHSDRKYNQFGLPFIHVFISTLLSIIALGKLALFLLQGKRRRLILPIFQIVWCVLLVSRGTMMVALFQYLALWLCIRGISLRAFFRIAISLVLVILLFGYLGDMRSGSADTFRKLAQPTSNYPDWLPSGVLWFYIYLTSPLDNLSLTAVHGRPNNDILFPETTYYFYPTPIRHLIFGNDSSSGSEVELVDSSLNVSSAYIGPYIDYGYLGIAAYSLLLGVLSAFAWRTRTSLRGILLYVLVAQCLVFSVFYNFLFYNPFLGQIFWVFLIFSRRRLVLIPRAESLLAPSAGDRSAEA